MAEASAVYFETRKDWNKIIAIHHGVKLQLFEVQHEFDSSHCINVNQHKLINKVVLEVSKVS